MGYKIALTILLVFVLAASSSATTYYVSKSGTGGDGRSWANAWTTISQVNSGVSSGDTVFFGTGTWIGTQLRCVAGTYSDRTVYACSSFVPVNGDGEYHYAKIWGASSLSNANQNVIQCHYDNNCRLSYVTLWGLELAYGRPRVISIYGVTVDSFFVEHCKLVGAISSSYDNPSLWHSGTMVGSEGSFNRVVACSLSTAYGPGGGHGCGLDTYSQNDMTVDSCIFYGHFDGACLWWKNDNDGRNYRNVVKNSLFTPTSADYSGGVWLYRNQNNDSVYNNVFAGGLTRGVRVGNASGRPNNNTVIVNNTFINCAGLGGDRNCIDGDQTTGTVFKYNIEYRTTTPFQVIGECLGSNDLEIDSNMYVVGSAQAEYGYANYVSQSYWINTLGHDRNSAFYGSVSNIGFADYNNGDYRRSPDSVEMTVYYDNRTWLYYGANLTPGVGCPPPPPPSLAGPANGATGISLPVSLTWNSSSGADIYQVNLDNSPLFNSRELDEETTDLSATVSGLQTGMVYYWRVRAADTCGWGAWSEVWTFTVLGTVPGDTISPSPIDDLGALPGSDNGEIILSWTAPGDDGNVGTLDRYEVMWSLYAITEDSWSADAVLHNPKTSGEAESYAITDLKPGFTYYVAVRGFDDGGNGTGISDVVESFAAGIRPPPWLFTSVDEFGQTASLTCSTVVSYMDVDTYRFALVDSASGDTTFQSTSIVNNETLSVEFTNLDESALYYWLCQAVATGADSSYWSQPKKFRLSNVSPDPPSPDYPRDYDTVITAGDEFTIIIANGTDDDSTGALRYDFELYGQSSSSPLVTATDVSEEEFTTGWTVPASLPVNITYSWRARSFDGLEYSFWMDWAHFTIIGFSTGGSVSEPDIIAYPNPVHFTQGEYITFRLPDYPVDLLIQTVSGETVLLKTDLSGNWHWYGENSSGNTVAVGIYSWFVRGTNQSGKIVVKP